MADITGATTASVSAITTVTSTGPASGLSAGASAVGGFLQSLSGLFQTVPGVKLPLTNPLFNYASYDYVLSISSMTPGTYNSAGYVTGRPLPIICKSANADPSNRIQTDYGSFDFFIDNLELKTVLSGGKRKNANVIGTFTFTITEPYSLGMFPIALQKAAENTNNKNWRFAPFLLTIQFRGSTEQGIMSNIPGTTRYIPFKFISLDSKTNQNGTVYNVTAVVYNMDGFADKHSKLKTDVSIKGTTVQEMLSTGEKSLQAALNVHPKSLVKDKTHNVPWAEYVIIFPIVGSPNTSPASTSNTGATVTPLTSTALYSQLGVARDPKTGLLLQTSECNPLGKSKMTFSVANKGNIPVSNDSVIYNKGVQQPIRGNMVINYQESDFKFTQHSDVPNAINQVLLQSMFPGQTLDASQIGAEGYKGWWRIECVKYIVEDDSNLQCTGTLPELVVYRVVPWLFHGSVLTSMNTQAPGFDNLSKQVVKKYDYIYTGKNVDIINFNIEYNVAWVQKLGAASAAKSQDAQLTGQDSGAAEKDTVPVNGTLNGVAPVTLPGVASDAREHSSVEGSGDRQGGGGNDTMETRASRQLDKLINDSVNMLMVDLEIIGDPYWIAHSGMGTYNAQPTQFVNLNSDGSVNYQSGEVDLELQFSSPLDINQATGLYNFSGLSKNAPVIQFTGFYKVLTGTSRFRNGVFTQNLQLQRRPNQEKPTIATPDQTINVTTPAPGQATLDQDGNVTEESKANPNNYGGG
jgi:hypothetical protein